MRFYNFNYNSLIFMIPAFASVIIVQLRIKSTYNKYFNILNINKLTAADSARCVLDVEIVC